MKRPEEGALGGPVLAGNPVTDPMATQADRAVEPGGAGASARLGTRPLQFNLFGGASSSEKILDGC